MRIYMNHYPNQGAFPPPNPPGQLFYPSVPPYQQIPASSPVGAGGGIPTSPLLLDLLLFPLRCLRAYVLPLPFVFAAESKHARWGIIWTYISCLPLLISGLAYLCSSLPQMNGWGVRPLSLNTVGSCIGYGLIGTLALFFLYQGLLTYVARKLRGTGTFVAQCYTILLSLAMTATMTSVVGMLLFTNPALHPAARHWLIIAGCAVLSYGFVQLALAISSVHRLPLYKGLLLVVLPLLGIVVLAISILADHNYRVFRGTPVGKLILGEHTTIRQGAGWQSASRHVTIEIRCPSCQSTAWILSPYRGSYCPRCGTPMTPTGVTR
jgi:hypothetical protein